MTPASAARDDGQTTAPVPRDGDPALVPDAILTGAQYDFARGLAKAIGLLDAALLRLTAPPRRRTRWQRHMLRAWSTPRHGKRDRRRG
jgi:hypothetical protein